MGAKSLIFVAAAVAGLSVLGQDLRIRSNPKDDTKALAKVAPEDQLSVEQQELDITSDTMEMDFDKKKAVFEGNVKVTDEQSVLTADKMIVFMTDADELKYIEAIGSVVIKEVGTKKTATAGRAEFDVEKNTIVLLENPSLTEGDKARVSEAEKIVYNRAEQKFTFSGRPTFRIKMPKRDGGMGPASLLSPMGRNRNTELKADE